MINKLSLMEKSLFFAKVSAIAYKDPKEAKAIYKELRFFCVLF